MVLDPRNLAALRQGLIQMSAPARWVAVAAAIAAHRLPSRAPLRCDHVPGPTVSVLSIQIGSMTFRMSAVANVGDVHVAEMREGILPQRGDDLGGVLAVAPFVLV